MTHRRVCLERSWATPRASWVCHVIMPMNISFWGMPVISNKFSVSLFIDVLSWPVIPSDLLSEFIQSSLGEVRPTPIH